MNEENEFPAILYVTQFLGKQPIIPQYGHLKGTVQRDFQPPVFFIIQTSLGQGPMG